MKTSVAYITCGVHELQQRTLQALLQHTPPECQIIILQNGTEIQHSILRDVTLLSTDVMIGVSHARNLCLDNTAGDVILWIDDHIEVCNGFVDVFLDNGAGITGYDTLVIQEDFDDQWYVDIDETDGIFDYVDSPYAVAVPMFDAIGTYDENTGPFVCDNTDLCLRAWEAGWHINIVQNPGLKHWRRSTSLGMRKLKRITPVQERTAKANVHAYMREKHRVGWHARYTIPTIPIEVDRRLQYPEITGRLGGPEDKAILEGI